MTIKTKKKIENHFEIIAWKIFGANFWKSNADSFQSQFIIITNFYGVFGFVSSKVAVDKLIFLLEKKVKNYVENIVTNGLFRER